MAGAPVAVVPWGDHFALFATDATGTVMCAGGDPQNGIDDWKVTGLGAKPGSAATIVAVGKGVDLVAVDTADTVAATSGGVQVMTGFRPPSTAGTSATTS